MTLITFLFSILASLIANFITSYFLRLIDNKNDHQCHGDH